MLYHVWTLLWTSVVIFAALSVGVAADTNSAETASSGVHESKAISPPLLSFEWNESRTAIVEVGAESGSFIGMGIVTFLSGEVRVRDLKPLAPWMALEVVNLRGCQMSDKVLKFLAQFSSLKHVNLDDTPITDRGIRHLGSLEQLSHLHVRSTQIGDKSMKTVSKIRSLVYLDIAWTNVSDAGLAELHSLKNLRTLWITRPNRDVRKITEEGERALQEALPDCSIEYRGL